MTTAVAGPTEDSSENYGLTLLKAWLLLAAFAQLAFVARWPLYIAGTLVPYWAAVWVAFVRLGVYAGLAWGLEQRLQAAWAATFLELARTFALFVITTRAREVGLSGAIFPAGWTQGMLSAALPLVIALNAGLSSGWSPRAGLDAGAATVARFLAAGSGLTALWLRRRLFLFPHPRPDAPLWRALLSGVPVATVLAVIELLALSSR